MGRVQRFLQSRADHEALCGSGRFAGTSCALRTQPAPSPPAEGTTLALEGFGRGISLSVVEIALVPCGGYVAVSVMSLVLIRPAMRASAEADRAADHTPRATVEPTYASLAIQRVTEHAATMLGASEACLVVRAGESVVVVAQHG